MLEAKIQNEIVKELRRQGFYCHSCCNEQAHGNAIHTGQLIAMGLVPGVADLVVWIGSGKIAYLEVKTPKGKQSEKQILFESVCKKYGYPYKVVRSAEEAMAFVQGVKIEQVR